MRRLIAILAMLALVLTGCSAAEEFSAKREDTPVGATNSPAQTETIETPATPEASKTPETTAPTDEPAPDGWDGVLDEDGRGDPGLPSDYDLIPPEYRDYILDWMKVDWGIVAILDIDKIVYFREGEVVFDRDVYVDPSCNFLFDANEFDQNAQWRWFAYVDNSIIRLEEYDISYDAYYVADLEYTGINWRCLSIDSGILFSWSPSNVAPIDNEVTEVYTKQGYIFYRKNDQVYVVNANAWAIARQTQDYVDKHPLESVLLGNGQLYDYYFDLDPRAGESNGLAAAAAFETKYGLDTVVWGDPQ